MLIEQAQRVLCESRKLLKQRETQLEQQEQFLEQHATIAHEMLGDTAIRAPAVLYLSSDDTKFTTGTSLGAEVGFHHRVNLTSNSEN